MKKCIAKGCQREKVARGMCQKHYMRYRRSGESNIDGLGKKIDFQINEEGCFICTSHKTHGHGYFGFRRNQKRYLLHRFIYEEMFGEIPEGLVVRHKCDNKKCINPEHMELGTIADNVRDAVERNLFPTGEKHYLTTLTERKVIEIKRSIKQGETLTSLSREYGVCIQTIANIKNGVTWKYVIEKGV
ncbi:HNH endonuclease [Bacillus mycoides]|uniref:HNH endonuclease n=1 Tax=Bacillus mycoides TaxID=1405 RepID=UPI002E2371A1|nr:HNH endonuclease [Bacillus mycoides]